MTKLDWSKGYTSDPARVRSVEDFSSPDPVVILSERPLKKRKPKTWEQLEERKRRRQARLKPPKPKKPISKRVKLAKPKDERTEEEKALEAAERRAKRTAHNARYLAITASKERAMASKKMSHLQAWAEKQGVAGLDRLALRERLRATLLRKKP